MNVVNDIVAPLSVVVGLIYFIWKLQGEKKDRKESIGKIEGSINDMDKKINNCTTGLNAHEKRIGFLEKDSGQFLKCIEKQAEDIVDIKRQAERHTSFLVAIIEKLGIDIAIINGVRGK